ncbi:GyrI-like domain-containing protein [candidate division CSSED10-310 bacterium]|uniref:GyrI-like domain-containing protein n=1 Tax=candidate division CSSED10-310 bacterium TaxID=2855610 RepID=A0ABV6YVF8_UNCC1
MTKIDYKKKLKHLYLPSKKEIVFVEVPAMNFVMIDGQGDPNTAQSFKDAVESLYSVSYTLKFMVKKGELGLDYGVLPLEGLWWTENMAAFSVAEKDEWQWTLMIMQPEFITRELYEAALLKAGAKKKLVALDMIRYETFHEGSAAQILYIGPFAAEGPTIQSIHAAIHKKGQELTGKHHEIYLSDFRKTAPEKLKTVIR